MIIPTVLGITSTTLGITMTDMTRLTTKGQVTIPKRLRDHLGLQPGSSVEFELAGDGRVFLKAPQQAPKSKFARLRGSAKLCITTDELMALTRGEEEG
jgi:AbrB family looped-hinge helix DNA binding protein